MNIKDVTFDNFMSLDSKDRRTIINDPELLKELIRKNLSTHRYEHSLSVARLCVELARRHKVDINKAYMAGLLHDVCKDLDHEVIHDYLRYYDSNKLNGIYGAYHSWMARYYLREKLNFHDKDILNAIYNHTICNSKDKLSLILYIADKREPLRNINDGIVEIAYNNLYKAYELLEVEVEKYLKEKNERIIKDSL